MSDFVLILTPCLVLGIVALFGFIGCYQAPTLINSPINITPSSGPTAGGTLVTITGEQNFATNTIARFDDPPNNIDAPATFVSASLVTVVTPAHAAGAVPFSVEYDIPDGPHVHGVTAFPSLFLFYANVVPLQPLVLSRKNGAINTAALPAFPGSKLVVATVQWGAGTGAALGSLSAPGVSFTQVGTTDVLNPQQVETFYAVADLTSGLSVTATLTAASDTEFNLLLSAYDNADLASAPASPVSRQGVGISPGPSLTFQTSALSPGDLIYAVAIARAGSVLAGSWSPGSGFAGEAGQNGYLLLETYTLQQSDIDSGQISVTATDASGTATSRWYLFAVALKHV